MKAHDYIKLAQAIQDTTFAGQFLGKIAFLNALCDILAADNKKFDKVKFLEACK